VKEEERCVDYFFHFANKGQLRFDTQLAKKLNFSGLDLLLDRDTLQRMFILRNHLADMKPDEAMEFLRKHMINTTSNEEFIASMNG